MSNIYTNFSKLIVRSSIAVTLLTSCNNRVHQSKINHNNHEHKKTSYSISSKAKALTKPLMLLSLISSPALSDANSRVNYYGGQKLEMKTKSMAMDSGNMYLLHDVTNKAFHTETKGIAFSNTNQIENSQSWAKTLPSTSEMYSVHNIFMNNKTVNIGYIEDNQYTRALLWESDLDGNTIYSTIINTDNEEKPVKIIKDTDDQLTIFGNTDRNSTYSNIFTFNYYPNELDLSKKIQNYKIHVTDKPAYLNDVTKDINYWFTGQYMTSDTDSDILIGEMNSTTYQIQNAIEMGGSFHDGGNSILCHDNSVIVGGFSTGTGFRDILINKHDMDLNPIYTYVLSGYSKDDEILTMYPDNEGNIYLGGKMTDQINGENQIGYLSLFDPGQTEGEFLWEKQIKSSNVSSEINTVCVPSIPNINTSNYFYYAGNIDTNSFVAESMDSDECNFLTSITTNRHEYEISKYMNQAQLIFETRSLDISEYQNTLFSQDINTQIENYCYIEDTLEPTTTYQPDIFDNFQSTTLFPNNTNSHSKTKYFTTNELEIYCLFAFLGGALTALVFETTLCCCICMANKNKASFPNNNKDSKDKSDKKVKAKKNSQKKSSLIQMSSLFDRFKRDKMKNQYSEKVPDNVNEEESAENNDNKNDHEKSKSLVKEESEEINLENNNGNKNDHDDQKQDNDPNIEESEDKQINNESIQNNKNDKKDKKQEHQEINGKEVNGNPDINNTSKNDTDDISNPNDLKKENENSESRDTIKIYDMQE